ncbi:MAG: LPS export ABC transporter permease LptF, partial [Candidatus Aminicenantales bacterium]
MFKYFDRYLIKELTPPFLLGLLITTFVFLMNEILLLSEIFITKGVSLKTTLNILVYLIPSIIAFTLPMSVLMGILGGLSRLSSDSEIMAFKTLGISYKRLLRLIFIFSLGGWLLTSFLTLYLAPRANYKWVQTLSQSVLAKVQLEINPREFNESIPNIVIYIQDISPDKSWQNIFLYLSRDRKEPKVILAKKGKLNFYPEKKRAILELTEGSVHSYPEADPEKYRITTFKKLDEEINVASLFPSLSKKKRVREKDIKELVQDLSLLKKDLRIKPENEENKLIIRQTTRNYISHWVEIHKKFALPFACLVFAFLGLPLGAYTRKGGRTSGFTISLAIILIYYILITAGEKMAMDGKISAWAGMWGPNIILAGVGLYLFSKALKEKPLFSSFSFLKNFNMRKIFSFPKKKAVSRGPRLLLRFPNILDRYLLRKYLLIFSLVFLALLLILIIITFFERIDNIYEHNKSIWMLLEFIRYNIPEFIHYALPVTVLTATLLSLGLLTKSNEITAMKACGLSLYRIIMPVILMGVVASLCSFYLQERILPY